MKLSFRAPTRRGTRRAAWGAVLVALTCAVPVVAHSAPSADAADGALVSASQKKDEPCVPPVVTPPPVPVPPTPTVTPTPTAPPTPGNTTTPTPGNTTVPAPTTPTTPVPPVVTPTTTWPITSIRINQANLKAGEAMPKFTSDLANVFATTPDFVSFNEVPFRPDSLLAPIGYELFRTPGQYTGASPVAWRTDRWMAINKGTAMISNKKGRERGQHVDWGIRYANWVTVRSLDGCQTVSMIATHLAPKNSITANLMGPSMQRLGALVAALSTEGPVFVAGDFNRHYTAADYPRAELTAAGLTPTYDMTGTYLPTGDHRGATIDYVFLRPSSTFTVLEQTTTELYSDHDLLSVALTMPARTIGEQPVTFAPGTSVNDPDAPNSAPRRSVLRTIRAAIRNATDGAELRVATARLQDRALGASLRRAARLGVEVKVVSGSTKPSKAERALIAALGTRRSADSWIVFRPHRFATRPLSPTTLLANRTGATTYLVLTADRPLDATISRELAQAKTVTARSTYRSQVKAFARLAKG